MSNIETLIQEIHTYVKQSHEALEKDEDAPTEVVQVKVGELCQKIAAFPHDDAKAHEAALVEALSAVEALEEALRNKQKETMGALENTQKHSAAMKAYTQHLKK